MNDNSPSIFKLKNIDKKVLMFLTKLSSLRIIRELIQNSI